MNSLARPPRKAVKAFCGFFSPSTAFFCGHGDQTRPIIQNTIVKKVGYFFKCGSFSLSYVFHLQIFVVEIVVEEQVFFSEVISTYLIFVIHFQSSSPHSNWTSVRLLIAYVTLIGEMSIWWPSYKVLIDIILEIQFNFQMRKSLWDFDKNTNIWILTSTFIHIV